MLDENIYPYYKCKNGINIKHKDQIIEFKNPINYSWKQLYSMMNKIKIIWRKKKFDDIKFTLNSQELHKIIYTNLKYCNRIPNLNLKNKIFESEINSFFQSNLFEILPKEKKLYDIYDDLFAKKKYIPKKDESNKALFEDFIIKFKDFYYIIQNNQKSMRQLKKMRWYMVFDEDNFFEVEFKKKEDDLKKKNYFIFFSKSNDINDSFDETERKKIFVEYNQNKNNKIEDNLEELYEKYIIDDELIDKLFTKEKNPFFYIIKLIYITIYSFCLSKISHLLYTFLNTQVNKKEARKAILINEYLKCFNNFVDSCTIIDEKCVNINLAMNYLYESLLEGYPKFPKFSIYRMCLKIWFATINTHLIGQNTLLYEIREILSAVFSETLKSELLGKFEEGNIYNFTSTKSVNTEKEKKFYLSTSFSLFQSISYIDNINSLNDFSSQFNPINVYDKNDKHYKILEKGLSIINDTFSNEYSVYYLNSSIIDTNNFYDNLVYSLLKCIKCYIAEVFNVYIYKNESSAKAIIDNIFNYFDNYFYKNFIIPNLQNKIYEAVYLCIKNNLLEFAKNKYFEQDNHIKKNEINLNQKSVFGSAETNWCSNMKSSSFFDINSEESVNNININNNNKNKHKEEIINYIISNIPYEINKNSTQTKVEEKLELINQKINIYDLFSSVYEWHDHHKKVIEKNDDKVLNAIIGMKNIMGINIPLEFDQTKRYLLSYSLQYDWEFLRKVKTLEKYYFTNKDENAMIEDNDIGNNYLDELDNIGQENNTIGNNNFNLRSSSFFDFNL